METQGNEKSKEIVSPLPFSTAIEIKALFQEESDHIHVKFEKKIRTSYGKNNNASQTSLSSIILLSSSITLLWTNAYQQTNIITCILAALKPHWYSFIVLRQQSQNESKKSRPKMQQNLTNAQTLNNLI